MKILSFTAGAARMYCGSCLRDNSLAAELKRQGHDVILQPLYTPTRTDETNVSESRVFLNGIHVYLAQQSAYFRREHRLLDRIVETPWLLDLASRRSIAVDPQRLGAMTVSMLRGEEGYQRTEIRKLKAWLAAESRPDVAVLPNSLLIGLARSVREALRRPVCCTLQGEELFLSHLPEPYRTQALHLIREDTTAVDAFIAVSRHAARYWVNEMGIPESKMHVVPIGIHIDAFDIARKPGPACFTVGYLARIAPEKGLDELVQAYIHLRSKIDFGPARLRAAGYMAAEHAPYLARVTRRLKDVGLEGEFNYQGELDRAQKLEFLRSVDVFSVPCTYDEPKGISVIEAMAVGVPVVQPRRGAFVELIERTGGGLLCDAGNPASLAEAIHQLAQQPALGEELGRAAAAGVRAYYTAAHMAARAAEVYRRVAAC